MTQHVFNVKMACGGCSGAVERVLKKQQDVQQVTIDMEAQTVTVESTMSADALLAIIKKTGKETSYKGEA
eukprot:m.13317 g.13317  ORF g.13317 m.13317 type:complete len:70 (-) comp5929_c0_seq1:390-599(-)